MDASTFAACPLTHAVSMTSLMVAPLPEDTSLPGSVALKPEITGHVHPPQLQEDVRRDRIHTANTTRTRGQMAANDGHEAGTGAGLCNAAEACAEQRSTSGAQGVQKLAP